MHMTKILMGAVVGAGLLLGAGPAAQALPFAAVGAVAGLRARRTDRENRRGDRRRQTQGQTYGAQPRLNP